jgi:hypothetical protein
MEGFSACSVETRSAVFFDLLVDLLAGFPERQSSITKWPEFQVLPMQVQAHLLRLMASQAVVKGVEQAYIRSWLDLSRELNPADWRGALLSASYKLSPFLCQALLRGKTLATSKPLTLFPVSDLE